MAHFDSRSAGAHVHPVADSISKADAQGTTTSRPSSSPPTNPTLATMSSTPATIAGTLAAMNSTPTTHSLPPIVPFNGSEHKVTHHYHDHANDPDGDAQQLLNKSGGPGCEQSFPMKLHYMLGDIEQDNLSHIVSWAPHGRCFVVHNQRLFVEKILGCWFRQSKIASFQRQLNIYGFQRLTTGPDKNGYYHELFLRGKPGLAARIHRQKLKGTKTRRAASPESEPNFYAMTPLPPNAKPAAGSTPKVAVPLTSAALPSILGSKASSRPTDNVLTLQKIVPSLFSPAAFETTVHSGQHGLMVTSRCHLTLKPSDDVAGGTTFSVTQFPTTATLTFPGSNNPVVPAAASTLQGTSNDTFWTALSGGALTRNTTNGDTAAGIPVPAPAPLWLPRR